MYTLTGGGAFTRVNIDQINSNFREVSGGSGSSGSVDVYINPANGNNNNNGLSPGSPKATMAGCSSLIAPGIRIGLLGVLTEEFVMPIVSDVSIIGLANQPRQATTSGAPNGGGSTWLSPSGGSGILLKVRGQGTRIENIYFNNSSAQPCIQILTDGAGDPPVDSDGAHAQILGNIFTGADAGIQVSGGTNFVTIAGNTFFNFTGTGDTGIEAVTGAGVGTLWGWKLLNNVFYNNVNHVILPCVNATITGNNFIIIGGGSAVTSTIALSLTGGAKNSVYNNMFNRPVNTSPNATLFVGGTSDVWSQNYGSDAVFFGVPDNS